EAADVVIGVDEFVPGTNYFEARGLQGKFERVAQGVANGGFRSRATREAKLRPFKTLRATVISTGEQMPLLTSVRARTLNLEFGRGAIDSGKLTEAQRIASRGIFGRAMAGYIAFLAKPGEREAARNRVKKYGEQMR